MWAKGHSDSFREWLQEAGINRPPSETAAEQQAYELAVAMALARERGTHVAGAAEDWAKCWAKCYDNIALPNVYGGRCTICTAAGGGS